MISVLAHIVLEIGCRVFFLVLLEKNLCWCCNIVKKLYFCGVEKKGGIVMVGDLADPVLRRMLSECFGDGNGKQRRCVMAFFSRCREAVESFENVNLKGVGMMQPKYMLAWRRYLRGLQALKDVDYIGRKCVDELEEMNRGDEYVGEMVRRYKLEKYYDK